MKPSSKQVIVFSGGMLGSAAVAFFTAAPRLVGNLFLIAGITLILLAIWLERRSKAKT
jgi:hypothetical protein